MLELLYALFLLVIYAAAVVLGLYGWWSGGWAVGLALFLGAVAFATLLALPLVLGSLIDQILLDAVARLLGRVIDRSDAGTLATHRRTGFTLRDDDQSE